MLLPPYDCSLPVPFTDLLLYCFCIAFHSTGIFRHQVFSPRRNAFELQAPYGARRDSNPHFPMPMVRAGTRTPHGRSAFTGTHGMSAFQRRPRRVVPAFEKRLLPSATAQICISILHYFACAFVFNPLKLCIICDSFVFVHLCAFVASCKIRIFCLTLLVFAHALNPFPLMKTAISVSVQAEVPALRE